MRDRPMKWVHARLGHGADGRQRDDPEASSVTRPCAIMTARLRSSVSCCRADRIDAEPEGFLELREGVDFSSTLTMWPSPARTRRSQAFAAAAMR
jgi:hypothetical protein